MKDKFRVNFFITLPAAIITLAIYTFLGTDLHTNTCTHGANIVKVIPYFAVLITAIAGLDVMTVLVLGISLTGIVGIATGTTNLFDWMHSMGDGIMGMGELIIVTMLAGGLFEIVKSKGGVEYIIESISSRIKGKRGAEAVIGLLVAVIDICTANNTVAIISVGNIAKRIGEKYGQHNVYRSVYSSYHFCGIGKGSSKNKDPQHQHYVASAGTTAKCVNAVFKTLAICSHAYSIDT